MEGIYTCSSSERILNSEKELERELKDLQDEIESGGIIGKKDLQSFRLGTFLYFGIIHFQTSFYCLVFHF